VERVAIAHPLSRPRRVRRAAPALQRRAHRRGGLRDHQPRRGAARRAAALGPGSALAPARSSPPESVAGSIAVPPDGATGSEPPPSQARVDSVVRELAHGPGQHAGGNGSCGMPGVIDVGRSHDRLLVVRLHGPGFPAPVALAALHLEGNLHLRPDEVDLAGGLGALVEPVGCSSHNPVEARIANLLLASGWADGPRRARFARRRIRVLYPRFRPLASVPRPSGTHRPATAARSRRSWRRWDRFCDPCSRRSETATRGRPRPNSSHRESTAGPRRHGFRDTSTPLAPAPAARLATTAATAPPGPRGPATPSRRRREAATAEGSCPRAHHLAPESAKGSRVRMPSNRRKSRSRV